jgi:hypothetical protein
MQQTGALPKGLAARLRRIAPGAIAALVLGGSLACHDHDETTRAADAARRWTAESAYYESRLARWLRDSAVIDSIARTVDDDSLRSLYRQLVATETPAPILQAILCEQTRLADLHGYNALGVVGRRVRRAELGPDPAAAMRRVEDKLPTMLFHVTGGPCGEPGPRGPDSVGSTSLRQERPRPSPPQRPRP